MGELEQRIERAYRRHNGGFGLDGLREHLSRNHVERNLGTVIIGWMSAWRLSGTDACHYRLFSTIFFQHLVEHGKISFQGRRVLDIDAGTEFDTKMIRGALSYTALDDYPDFSGDSYDFVKNLAEELGVQPELHGKNRKTSVSGLPELQVGNVVFASGRVEQLSDRVSYDMIITRCGQGNETLIYLSKLLSPGGAIVCFDFPDTWFEEGAGDPGFYFTPKAEHWFDVRCILPRYRQLVVVREFGKP
jgi:hypothetical protein